MKEAIEIIQKHARELKKLELSEQYLFEQLNTLSPDLVEQLIDDFTSEKFQPVNLLRFDILHKIKNHIPITPGVIEEIEQKIIERDEDYFSQYGDAVVKGLLNYPQKKKTPFVSWQKIFRIVFPFFYPAAVRKETDSALHDITSGLLQQLQVPHYKSHAVSFWGPQNYGSSYCWIALFPRQKVSHRKAYQLFLHIDAEILEAGMLAGWDINDKPANTLEDFNSLEEVIEKLKASRDTAEKKNDALINYWKFAPGENGMYWEEWYQEGIIAIGWDEVGDLNTYTTETLAEALHVDDPNNSNQIWNIENFRDASIGDVVIANKGKSKALGIGIISGEYMFDATRQEFHHTRSVNWFINDLVDFGKTIFRPDTFSPTLKWKTIKETYLALNASYASIFEQLESGKEFLPPPKALPTESDTQNFWWLNVNPKIWRIDSYELGDIQSYTSYNDKGNKRRIYKYFEAVQPGDLMIGYESSPVKQIKAIFEITEALHTDDNEGEIINFEIKEIVKTPISWEELKETKGLERCEVFINNQGSLFSLTPDEFEIIRDLIDERNILSEKEREEIDVQDYSFRHDPDTPFLKESELQDIIYSLQLKKNIVLQGPPGVGKTFVAKKIAYEMMRQTDDSRIEMVQFHQSYAYEDFIQGIRPVEKLFKVKNGVFYGFCKKAELDPENQYFFIIDEINRGNLSKIFGELMMLIESDKRGKYSIPLTYSEKDDAPFSVPANLYLIGTMNTADRSLAIVDYALRRRFRFITLQPSFNQKFLDFLEGQDFSSPFLQGMIAKLRLLNDKIRADKNLGPGFLIGHSYFCNHRGGKTETEWFEDIVKFEIAPLLEEYWFDDPENAAREVELLLA